MLRKPLASAAPVVSAVPVETELSWLDPEQLSQREVAGALAVLEAARRVDAPHQLGRTSAQFAADLRHGWDGHPPRTAVTTDAAGRVVGVLGVSLPQWDNLHLAEVGVTVDPTRRREGIGSRLFTAGTDVAREAGRTLVVADCWDLPAGVGFAKAMGLDRASEAVKRTQDLLETNWARLTLLVEEARTAAHEYELIRLAGAIPPEMVAEVGRMTEAINDAPLDDLEIEDEVFTPERMRAMETAAFANGRRLYRLVARQSATGALVGQTVVAVECACPWQAAQLDTSVLRDHRGHRLGLLLKAEMLLWLRQAEPQVRSLDTYNAASNAHMIKINETLGYRVVAHLIEWQRHL